jgi:hypothetical protein
MRDMDDQTKRIIIGVAGLVAIVGPALFVVGSLTKAVIGLGIAFTGSTGPIGAMITAIGLLTGAYVMHKMTVTETESATKSLVTMNAGFAQALNANATQMAGFADEAGRTAVELEAVNDAFKVMVAQATARAQSLEQSLFDARKELIELRGASSAESIFRGYEKDSARVEELNDQIKALEQSLTPLYGFLVKAGEGMEAFASATADAGGGQGGEVVAMAGSINALTSELEGLQIQFEATASGVERAEFADKIRELEAQLVVLRASLQRATAELRMLDETGMAGSEGFDGSQWDSQYLGAKMFTNQMKLAEGAAYLAQQATTQFIDSVGAGLANVILKTEHWLDALKNIGKLLLSSAIQTAIKLLLVGTSGFGVTGGSTGLLGGLFSPQVSSVPTAVMGAGTMSVTGQFKVQGTDLIAVINRSERQLR